MMMKITKLFAGIFLSAWLVSSPLLAQSTTWSFGTFTNIGVVDEVTRNLLLIDDMQIQLSPTLKFTTADNSDASIDLLKKKQMVGYTIIIINNRLIIDHIWLIPENERVLYRPLR